MMMWWGHGYDWSWMIFGSLMMILFWGGLIALAVVAVRAFMGSGSQRTAGPPYPDAPKQNRALDILKERYARGEIGKAEYEEMREDLSV